VTYWPGINEWLFSFKTFAAAMLALYIAFAIGLDRPFWAMTTVYITAHPLTGIMRSKAVYRLIGTLVGAIAVIVLVPNLVNAPEMLCLALALWIGLCLYLGLLDRSPRGYLFLLAGYSTALVGFPAVATPDRVWNIALARVEEIWLGIICATVIGSVVFPRALGPVIGTRIMAWVSVAAEWADEALRAGNDKQASAARMRLAADAVEMRMLVSSLAYDTSQYQTSTRWVAALQRRMVALLPLLSSIGDRVTALRAAGGIGPAADQLLSEIRDWMRVSPVPPRSEADRLRGEIARLAAETDPRAGWNEVMLDSLLLRLRELIDVRQDMRDLRLHVEAGGGPLKGPLSVSVDGPAPQHHDHVLALLSAFAAALTILTICAFWIASAWQAGAGAAGLAAVACCLFAALDDPAPAICRFVISTILAVVAVGIGLFGILPLVHSFETLALVLGAFFVPVALLATIPATQSLGTALGFITATQLSLQNAYSADFATYANNALAAVLGLACAAVLTALVRSVGAEWSARRLMRDVWRDLAAIPKNGTQQKRTVLLSLLLDRLGLLVPRLAVLGKGNDQAAIGILQDLRVGVNMVELQQNREPLPHSVRLAVDNALFGTASHFAARAAMGHRVVPSSDLLHDIDRAMDVAVTMESPRARVLLRHLVGLRLSLFAEAAPYQPPAPPAKGASAPIERVAA
jgi:uncharacterized membrane protein YccC